MTATADLPQTESRSVHANGIDIHYLEAGEGEPLVLLHGGVVSTNPIWTGVPISYASHMATLSARFRVIAPDTRGAGRTVHSGGTVTFDLLADDVAALIDALGLDRPLVAGFSEGGITATVLGIRHPGTVRAIANHAGYDAFDPEVFPTLGATMRQMLGGSPDATEADPDAAARFFSQSAEMQGVFELMKADEDSGQGKDHWREYLRLAFHRLTTSDRLHHARSGRHHGADPDHRRRPRRVLLGRGGSVVPIGRSPRASSLSSPPRPTSSPRRSSSSWSSSSSGGADADGGPRCARSRSPSTARSRPLASSKPPTTSPTGVATCSPQSKPSTSRCTASATTTPMSPRQPPIRRWPDRRLRFRDLPARSGRFRRVALPRESRSSCVRVQPGLAPFLVIIPI